MKVFSDLKHSFEENLSSSQILKSERDAFKGIIREKKKFLVKSIYLAAKLVDPCYCGCHLSGEEVTSAKEVCEEMNVEAALKQKRFRTTKRQFSYEASDEPITDALKKVEFSFFSVVVDVAIESLRERTGMMSDVAKKFSVLTNFPDLPVSELEKQAKDLCNTLTPGDQADLNYDELIVEMQSFPKQWPKQNMPTFDLFVFLEEKGLKEIYPNMWVALRIAVTTPVTVASAERSFSKLKLIKTYLRSTMTQELNGLAIISINREISKQVSYDDTTDDFAARKSRRVRF
ncbi:uncharacterized protein LOC143022291 [Oratosquilla oratoria]|uniref:uncharacterized protein LOC143022291 n=1 Tax=Oratosquilla oratoria TaxID=337810 RepID=UPI003F76A4D1